MVGESLSPRVVGLRANHRPRADTSMWGNLVRARISLLLGMIATNCFACAEAEVLPAFWQVTWRPPPRSVADRAARGSLGPKSRMDN